MTNDGIIYNISIHALREEGDLHLLLTPVRWRVISIHALREEGDLKGQKKVVGRYLFLSTPSARRATDATTTGSNTGTFLSTPSARRATDKR